MFVRELFLLLLLFILTAKSRAYVTPRVIILPIEPHEPTTEMIPVENMKHLSRMLARAKEESNVLDEAEEEEKRMIRSWEEFVQPGPSEQPVPSIQFGPSVQHDQSVQPGSSVEPDPFVQPDPSIQPDTSKQPDDPNTSDPELWEWEMEYHPQSMLIYLISGSVIGLALICFFAKSFAAFRRRVATLF